MGRPLLVSGACDESPIRRRPLFFYNYGNTGIRSPSNLELSLDVGGDPGLGATRFLRGVLFHRVLLSTQQQGFGCCPHLNRGRKWLVREINWQSTFGGSHSTQSNYLMRITTVLIRTARRTSLKSTVWVFMCTFEFRIQQQ